MQQLSQQQSTTMEVALKAFEHFKHGLLTGEWDAFLEMLTDDFTLWFPHGEFHGSNGKARTEIFFKQFVRGIFPEGLHVILDRVTSNETTVVFEFHDHANMYSEWPGVEFTPGQKCFPYKNRVAISVDIRGDKICAYREYFGSDGLSY
jgi:ketosteroid isomerase-like protein